MVVILLTVVKVVTVLTVVTVVTVLTKNPISQRERLCTKIKFGKQTFFFYQINCFTETFFFLSQIVIKIKN